MAFGRKTQPTLAEKLAGVAATKEAALSVFAIAADDLEAVAKEADELKYTADDEVFYLNEVSASAANEAAEARAKAQLIRESFLSA